jgi:hypothetical protein
MLKKQSRKQKHTRNSHTRRKYRGGDRAELLRFRYTTNPERVAWTEELYPYSSQIASLPGRIPWNEYSYSGTATVYKLGIKEDIFREITIEAKASKNPYSIFGGAACELYNAKFKKKGGPNLHETVDPTADVDILIHNPSILLQNETEIIEGQIDIVNFNMNTNTFTISPIYDDYTHWIFNQVVENLPPIAAQMHSPQFVAPKEEIISKLENVDLQARVGNILITREKDMNMRVIRIQCITTVQTKEGLQVTDHFCELLVDIYSRINLPNKHPDITNTMIYKLEDIPGISVPYLFVESPGYLLSNQRTAFITRKKILQDMPEKKDKIRNHYGRIIYLLNLIFFLKTNNYDTGNLTEYTFNFKQLRNVLLKKKSQNDFNINAIDTLLMKVLNVIKF